MPRMMDKPNDDFKPNILTETITKAVAGDKAAINEVLKAYEPYILAQASFKRKNRDGSVTEIVEEDVAQNLREALIREIPNFKAED